MSTYLSHPVYSLGDRKVTVQDTGAAGLLVSDAAHLEAAGFRWHHMCSPDVTAYDLAEQAVAELDGRSALGGTDVIVMASCLPENAGGAQRDEWRRTGDVKHLMDYPASRLQARFGLDAATVVGLTQQACTGLLGAIRVARALQTAEPDVFRRALCLTADRFPIGSSYEQAYNVISDGAAACVVSSTPVEDGGCYRIVAAHHLTNGALVKATDDETVGSYFSWTHRLVTETLDRAGVALGAVDWVVPQNTNPAAWRILSRLLKVDGERVFFPTLPDIGHMISGDNIANLHALDNAGVVEAGELVLLVMAGYGMNWQALLLEAV